MHSLYPMLTFWPHASRRTLRIMACVFICVLVAACGFRLKGVSPLPFVTLYTNIPENSIFGAQVRRAIIASSPNTRFVTEPREAQARLMQLSSNQTLRQVSIDAQGRIEEYELNLNFVFQLTDAKGRLLLSPTTLTATRELPYDATVVQAKQGEIATLFKEMQHSLVDRLVRRLTAPDVVEAVKNAEDLPLAQTPAASDENTGMTTPLNRPYVLPGAELR